MGAGCRERDVLACTLQTFSYQRIKHLESRVSREKALLDSSSVVFSKNMLCTGSFGLFYFAQKCHTEKAKYEISRENGFSESGSIDLEQSSCVVFCVAEPVRHWSKCTVRFW